MAIASGLALLSLARAILIPVTLALLLCFATSPLVRTLRRAGLGHASSVIGAVLSIATAVSWLVLLLGSHAVRIAENFPAYRQEFDANVRDLRHATLPRLQNTWDAAEQMLDPHSTEQLAPAPLVRRPPNAPPVAAPLAVEVHPMKATPIERLRRVLSWAWAPIGSSAIVVVVLVFALLERESLRDRFIRLAGRSELRITTTAINDAGERLSRYLARLFAVNIAVGLTLWATLSAIGLPYAPLFATLTTVLRFIPFLGVPVATLFAVTLSLGAAQGWTLALLTLLTFSTIELFASHVVEPRVYGHATGLSPLAIVLASIFWGWLWGPVGVLMATPLTMCLAVAGRHIESLEFFGIILGDGPALSMAQKFYQRALSGDPDEIIDGADGFLKERSLAAYCDAVLVPALQMGRIDWASGAISARQYGDLRFAIARVLDALDGTEGGLAAPRRRPTMLDEILSGSLAWRKRRRTQDQSPRREHGTEVRPSAGASVVLCLGMGLPADELATELLVRILHGQGIDARHIKDESDLDSLHMYGMATLDIATVCLVTMTTPDAREHGVALARSVAQILPRARSLGLLLPGRMAHPDRLPVCQILDRVAISFTEAVGDLEMQLRDAPRRTTQGSLTTPPRPR
jgi:predicted PurR-regulated permease PerM